MKLKAIIILFSAICCFTIYKIAYNEESYLLSIGDSNCVYFLDKTSNRNLFKWLLRRKKVKYYNNDYCKKNLKISNVINIINQNKKLKDKNVLTILDKSKYITIMIGFDELTSYKNVDNTIKKEFLDNYKKLLGIIRDNTKAKIIVIGFYPGFFNNYNYINKNIKAYCQNNDIIFINVENFSNNKLYFDADNNYQVSDEISKRIIEYMREN